MRVARWDGMNWSGLGVGLNDHVYALAVLPNGNLIAGGRFTLAGAVSAHRIARWDGTAWGPLGSGFDHEVRALAVLPNGDLVAGGLFNRAGGVEASRVARWDGVEWSALGPGIDRDVLALAVMSDGSLVAGGRFFDTANRVARWDGISWSAMGDGMNSTVHSLAVLPNGELIAGGEFTNAGGVAVNHIAIWSGAGWAPLGTGTNHFIYSMASKSNGDLLAGGWFVEAGGVAASRIAEWDGDTWSALGSGMNDVVYALTILPNGNAVAGGHFTEAGGEAVNRIAVADRHGAVAVVRNPISATVCMGESVTISVDVAGVEPRFQWRRGGRHIMGQTGSTLTIEATGLSDAGAYDCVVSDACGNVVTSEAAMLTVIPPPTIAMQPVDQAASVDASASFVVRIQPETLCASPSPFRYQWQRRDPTIADPDSPAAWISLQDGTQFVNTQSSALVIVQPIPGLATGYRCRIEGGCNCGVTHTDTVNFSIACPADFNADGGVDFSDVEAFFERWENGC